MRIVTWNCNGALRKKFQRLAQFDADVTIIQECEDPAQADNEPYRTWAGQYAWVGENKSRGLGVFTKPGSSIRKLDWGNDFNGHPVRLFLPVLINETQILLGVWTLQNKSPNFGYIGQFWKYLQLHKQKLADAIIAGDFNSNVRWDEWDRWWNHSDVVRELAHIGLRSVYHHVTGEAQGAETQYTLFHQRNPDKRYHIDYCFAPERILSPSSRVRVEAFTAWNDLSDHTPVVIDF